MASQALPSSLVNINLLNNLPAEIRLRIFAFTGLVCAKRSGEKTGLHIYFGKFSDPPAHYMYWHRRGRDCDCPDEFPGELLDPCHNPYYGEMVEVAFSQNRLVFAGSPVKTLEFLTTHLHAIPHIRHIEFQFDYEMIEELNSSDTTIPAEWENLIKFLRQNFNLPNLSLSVNAGNAICIYDEQQMTEKEGGDYRLAAYKSIIEPLRGLGVKGGLAGFYAFWACYFEYEIEAEREVMGPEYEPVDKVPISRREPSDPWWDSEKEKTQKEGREMAQEQEQERR